MKPMESHLRRIFMPPDFTQKEDRGKLFSAVVQSVARNLSQFEHASLLVIDECHRIGLAEDSQYQQGDQTASNH